MITAIEISRVSAEAGEVRIVSNGIDVLAVVPIDALKKFWGELGAKLEQVTPDSKETDE